MARPTTRLALISAATRARRRRDQAVRAAPAAGAHVSDRRDRAAPGGRRRAGRGAGEVIARGGRAIAEPARRDRASTPDTVVASSLAVPPGTPPGTARGRHLIARALADVRATREPGRWHGFGACGSRNANAAGACQLAARRLRAWASRSEAVSVSTSRPC